MKLRILTALVLIPPVLYLLGWAPDWLFVLAVVSVSERALYEFFVISGQSGWVEGTAAAATGALRGMGYISCAALGLLQWLSLRLYPIPLDLGFAALLGLVLSVSIVALNLDRNLKLFLPAVATTVLGVLYVGATFSCLIPLRLSTRLTSSGEGRDWVLLLFLATWAGDAGAYFTGQLIGRTPLAPRISPHKTVEGSIGGLIASLLMAWLFALFFWKTPDWKTVILLVGLVAVAGQVGDLAESALKRGASVKDSGGLLPGHGGMLDRIDSQLFAAPVLWIVLALRVWFRTP